MTNSETVAEYQQKIAELEQQLSETRDQLQKQISERKIEDDRSAGVHDRFQHLLSLLPAGVIVLNGSGVISEANPAAEAFLGQSLVNERWLDVINACFAPRNDDGHEVSLKNGKRVSLLTRAMDVEPGQLILLTDQTETRLLQGRLSHYQRLSEMGRMMASLAHQIRTPLSAALLYVDHLLRPDLQPEQRQRFAGKAKSRLTNLEQQVRDMLIFARGEMRLDDALSVSDLMCELEDMLDLPLVHYDADCECINEVPDYQLQCNKEALLGVCMNLVENSLQACGKGSELTIHFRDEQGNICIDIKDQGPGMDEQTVKQALEPFYTTKSHGTGLGLAVAQVVAHAHHGQFKLNSVAGSGTTASIVLPRHNAGSVTPETV